MDKLKWACDRTNLSFERDRAYGYSWPQRNYRCSFCKKEFKSAQALGGHMNVHRRDRARLRLSPNPNPNPSFAFPSTPSTAKLVSNYNLACNSSDHEEMGKTKEGTTAAAARVVDFTRRKDARVWKSNEVMRLDLNLGLFQDANEDLDLELRLGSS